MIIEMTVAMALLASIGLVVLKSSIDLMAPRQWTIIQNITDSYISYEQAYAERISFEMLTQSNSPWPIFPQKNSTPIVIGKMPGGHPVTATVIRTRIPGPNNIPSPGSANYLTKLAANPTEIETWQIQSHLVYKIGKDSYVKSRTMIRSQ